MAISALRQTRIILSGDITETRPFTSTQNSLSPASEIGYNLVSGNNTITVPSDGVTTVKAATIKPPSGNTQSLTIKGVNGDTGIAISKIDDTTISFDTAPANFVINAGGAIAGLRILWH